ncbi:unnamed protein product [Mytilus edulis]|uniref:Tyr recombinase domain-containing protein n=1 Tax=Mytilus edulis TaxID=6550 RepID=A0A8S3U1L0_MYTED|nr:unnamed protein product [Mytilus edulis]
MSEEEISAVEPMDESQLLKDDESDLTTADAVSLFNSSLNKALQRQKSEILSEFKRPKANRKRTANKPYSRGGGRGGFNARDFFVASAKNLDPEMTTTVNKTTPSSSTTTDCAFTAKDQDTLPVSVPSKHVPSVVPSQHQPLLQVLHPCLNEKVEYDIEFDSYEYTDGNKTDSATWREISQFANSNQQFTGCEKSIFNIVRSSKAISTNKKYDVYFKKFKEWCMTHKVIPLPASVSSVAVYISGLVQQSVSESVLLAHFYSIKWYHDFNLVCNPCEDKLIQMMIEGAKRILSKPVLKKEPITADHLQKIVDKIGSDRAHLPNVRICAMMLVGYAGFLRYSEIANLKMCNIKFFDTYVSLNIETGKTDVYRRELKVIASSTPTLCRLFFVKAIEY